MARPGIGGSVEGLHAVVAALAAGEIWKIDSDRRFCVLATGLAQPSALSVFQRHRILTAELKLCGMPVQVL